MTLHPPFIITARLMPGLHIGNAFVSGQLTGKFSGDGRAEYLFFVDFPAGQTFEVTDLRSGVGGGSLQKGFVTLLCLLSAAGDSWRHRGLNWDSVDEDDMASKFPRPLVTWAYTNSDELTMLKLELEENPNLISA